MLKGMRKHRQWACVFHFPGGSSSNVLSLAGRLPGTYLAMQHLGDTPQPPPPLGTAPFDKEDLTETARSLLCLSCPVRTWGPYENPRSAVWIISTATRPPVIGPKRGRGPKQCPSKRSSGRASHSDKEMVGQELGGGGMQPPKAFGAIFM